MSLTASIITWNSFSTDRFNSSALGIDSASNFFTASETAVGSPVDTYESTTKTTSQTTPQPAVSLFSNTSSLVSGTELESISKEIFSASPVSTQSATSNSDLPKINLDMFTKPDIGIKVFGTQSNADAETVRLIAANRSGLDVTLSEKAMSAIQSLNAKAAGTQVLNPATIMDGKVYIPAEISNFANTKSTFALGNAAQMFGTDSLNKDKRGSNPFVLKGIKRNNQEESKQA